MTISAECAFCRPEIASFCLWESAHYRIIADQYPLCVGHILLLSKPHFASHMHAPLAYLPELEMAQAQVRQFLLDNFGKASFWENGGIHQEVPHAHLHGIPASLSLQQHWMDEGTINRLERWEDLWQACQQTGHYSYVETSNGQYALQQDDQYATLLNEMRAQLTAQAVAEMQPGMDELKRHSTEIMDATIHIWKTWAQNKQPNAHP